tara:strand:- start:36293 stop:37354 length:1062 start_codon:yes stop_codon:yes gene_type:complete
MHKRIPEERALALQVLAGTKDFDAIREAVLAQAGAIPLSAAHPDADRLIERGNLLANWAASYSGRDIAGNHNLAVARGLAQSDFQIDLAGVLQRMAVRRFRAGQQHRRMASMIEVPNFNSYEFPTVDSDCRLLPLNDEHHQRDAASIKIFNGVSARVRTYGRSIHVSRQAIVNSQILELHQLFGNIGAHAARLEARALAELIASNPTLADAEPMFHVDHGNLITGTLGLSGLDAALGALRNQQTPGEEKADLPGAHLLVPANLEATAKSLVHQNGLGLEVHSSCWLTTANQWYVLADPSLAPVVGLMHLTGSDFPSVSPERDEKDRGGALMGAYFDFAAVALDRVGIVQVTPE